MTSRATWAIVLTIASVIWFGAIFGFFFAWVCSTLWGLDAIDPRVAIEAMNAMNASVRNPVFFTAFFLPPVVAAVAAVLCVSVKARSAAVLLGVAALVHAVGIILFTQGFNLPLNEGLAEVGTPEDVAVAQDVWTEYSGPWQTYNLIRAVVSGVTLALVGTAAVLLGRRTAQAQVTEPDRVSTAA